MKKANDQGSFLTGLVLGLFAGATGLFFLTTNEGKKLKTKLLKEWDEAKDSLADAGLTRETQTSLKDFLLEIFSEKEPTEAKTKATKTKAKRSTKSSKKKSTRKLFKGV